MTTDKKINKQTKYWAIAGLIISWATFWMFLFSPFGFLVWIGILIYLIVKKSHLKWYILFSAWLFVPSFSFLTGTIRYFTGTATLQGVGGPQTYHGIDRETRVASTSSGCIFLGFEPFVFPANNAAVRLWTNLFGYQRGAYTGIYPTEEETKEFMKTADTITVKQSDKFYEFAALDRVVQLDTSEFYRLRYYSEPLDKVIGKTVGQQCLLFQQLESRDDDDRTVYLVDIENKKLLTYYFL